MAKEENCRRDELTLKEIVDAGLVDAHTLDFIQHALVEALAERHRSGEAEGTIEASGVYVSHTYKSLTLIPKGKEPVSELADLKSYGMILGDAVRTRAGNKRLERISEQCIDGTITTFGELSLMLERRISNTIYIPLIIIIVILLGLLYWLNG